MYALSPTATHGSLLLHFIVCSQVITLPETKMAIFRRGHFGPYREGLSEALVRLLYQSEEKDSSKQLAILVVHPTSAWKP
jgi:hypothetical protein